MENIPLVGEHRSNENTITDIIYRSLTRSYVTFMAGGGDIFGVFHPLLPFFIGQALRSESEHSPFKKDGRGEGGECFS